MKNSITEEMRTTTHIPHIVSFPALLACIIL